MGSQYPPRGGNDEALWALQQAFKEAWSKLRDREPGLEWDNGRDRRSALASQLMSLAQEGVTHPAELSRIALEKLRGCSA
jgi:hypothetical protein